jgi:hypothetical protein
VSAADLLARLEACGARLALGEGDALTLTGKRPPAALLEEVKARKPDVLAHLRAQAVPVAVASGEDLPAQGVQSVDTLPARPDWAAIGAQPGRCGSCARAVDASAEWGEFMVTCSCDPVAWWPTSPPLAVHVGALCGAYLTPGEEVGRGWRAKGDRKAWGPLRPVPLEVSPPDELLAADHEGAA